MNSAYIITMTRLENLTMQLQYGVQNYGENDPLVQELKREIEELQSKARMGEGQQLSPARRGERKVMAKAGC